MENQLKNHIEPYDNHNQPIVDCNNSLVPLCYFNQIRLNHNQTYQHHLKDHESVCVLISGSCKIKVSDKMFDQMTRKNIWEEKSDSVYIPIDHPAEITALSDQTEIFIAGGKIDQQYQPFRIPPEEITKIQYGSDDTKTHRKIYHILGKNAEGRTGRLLVSELFTVGKGGWSGFPPHKHDTDRLPEETRFEEIYQFRFRPEKGFAAQFLYQESELGPVYHVKHGSTFLIDRGYHPVVVSPGYQMYYFTIIVGQTHRSLVQYFHPDHAYQLETIPGLKNMIAGFK